MKPPAPDWSATLFASPYNIPQLGLKKERIDETGKTPFPPGPASAQPTVFARSHFQDRHSGNDALGIVASVPDSQRRFAPITTGEHQSMGTPD